MLTSKAKEEKKLRVKRSVIKRKYRSRSLQGKEEYDVERRIVSKGMDSNKHHGRRTRYAKRMQ